MQIDGANPTIDTRGKTRPALAPQSVRVDTRHDGSRVVQANAPLGAVARNTGDWLHHWAAKTPDSVFLAQVSSDAWVTVTYAETLRTVRRLAASLLLRDLGPDRPILMLSGNGVEHGLLTLAAQYVGIPTVPVAEQYSLIREAHPRLLHVAQVVTPGMVFAADSTRFADALSLDAFADLEAVSVDGGAGTTLFSLLEETELTEDLDRVHASVGPDTVAKILFTSGSTSAPKGVITTQRMLTSNQAQIAHAWPFLQSKPPRIIDWLPWNHVFGGSHNFNMMLAHGGSLYIDSGRPTADAIARTTANIKTIRPTLSFNVPVGYALLTDVMEHDNDLREAFFGDLDLLFYAGASLPIDLWRKLETLAAQEGNNALLMTSSWGMTETAPASLLAHEPAARSGVIGPPVPGLSAKLVPLGNGRYEIRVAGPNVTPGYFRDEPRTKASFDDDGFLITGDAVRFFDEGDPDRGFVYDGRLSEDFKLLSGTWVQATRLRLSLIETLGDLAADIVVAGHDRMEVGLLIFPPARLRASRAAATGDGVLVDPEHMAALRERLAPLVASPTGSSMRVARVIVLAEPPSLGDGEMTDKGSLNSMRVLQRRKHIVDRLYDDNDPAGIRLLEA